MVNNMKEECLICSAPVKYLSKNINVECEICHKKESSNMICENSHYICNQCHMKGLTTIIDICLHEDSANPLVILDRIMSQDFCHMHGPEHHVIVASALLTAYHNAGAKINLKEGLLEVINRGSNVPGGSCGYWGACGAGVSTGIFISIITESTPLSTEGFKLANTMTSKSLFSIAQHGGPRCCKRDSYLAILEAIDFVYENFNIKLEKSEIKCNYSSVNKQCIKHKCPFH